MPISENAERVTATLPAQLIPDLEERAASEGLRKPEWIRKTLIAAIEGADEGPTEKGHWPADEAFGELVKWLERRFQALEIRAIHNRNACLFSLATVLIEVIQANKFARVAASCGPPPDMDASQERITTIELQASDSYDEEFKNIRDKVRALQRDGDEEGVSLSGSIDDLLAKLGGTAP